jgi:predicted RNase H-like nuclease (RuvC/YqgF family)
MATLKRIEKRMNEVEAWIKNFERGEGPKQTMDNMNWLLSQCRSMGDNMQQLEQNYQQVSMGMQQNAQLVDRFMEENDMVREWQAFLAELEKQMQEETNAVQEQETESLDAQEQAGDGEKMGEGDA